MMGNARTAQGQIAWRCDLDVRVAVAEWVTIVLRFGIVLNVSVVR